MNHWISGGPPGPGVNPDSAGNYTWGTWQYNGTLNNNPTPANPVTMWIGNNFYPGFAFGPNGQSWNPTAVLICSNNYFDPTITGIAMSGPNIGMAARGACMPGFVPNNMTATGNRSMVTNVEQNAPN